MSSIASPERHPPHRRRPVDARSYGRDDGVLVAEARLSPALQTSSPRQHRGSPAAPAASS